MRPLGISSSDDKLVEEVIKMILESIYDPTFSNYSHGFRPGRSCHTALLQLQQNFTGVKWFLITSQPAPTKGRIVMEKEWWQIRKSSLIKIAHGFLRFQKTTTYSVICVLYNT